MEILSHVHIPIPSTCAGLFLQISPVIVGQQVLKDVCVCACVCVCVCVCVLTYMYVYMCTINK